MSGRTDYQWRRGDALDAIRFVRRQLRTVPPDRWPIDWRAALDWKRRELALIRAARRYGVRVPLVLVPGEWFISPAGPAPWQAQTDGDGARIVDYRVQRYRPEPAARPPGEIVIPYIRSAAEADAYAAALNTGARGRLPTRLAHL